MLINFHCPFYCSFYCSLYLLFSFVYDDFFWERLILSPRLRAMPWKINRRLWVRVLNVFLAKFWMHCRFKVLLIQMLQNCFICQELVWRDLRNFNMNLKSTICQQASKKHWFQSTLREFNGTIDQTSSFKNGQHLMA